MENKVGNLGQGPEELGCHALEFEFWLVGSGEGVSKG